MQDPSLYSQIKSQVQQTHPQFPEQEHLKCPRCDSTNTKFCYYNNYNLSQPRHFCKSCRRYWTKGGALRNIPVGGGSRKNTKRTPSSSSSKRPAPAASPPISNNQTTDAVKSCSGEISETAPLKGDAFVGQFGNLLETGGSFSSLLGGTGGQFGNFLDGLGSNGPTLQICDHFSHPGSGQNLDPHVSNNNNTDGFLNGGEGSSGDNGCWSGSSNGWPDLAMYTPGSTFQ